VQTLLNLLARSPARAGIAWCGSGELSAGEMGS